MSFLKSKHGSDPLCEPWAIMFVCTAPKPMQEDALRQSLAINLTTGNFASADMMSTDAVIQAGVGLITSDATEKLVLPAHDTVRTFIFSLAARAAIDKILHRRAEGPGQFSLLDATSQAWEREKSARLLLGRACLVHIQRRTSRSLATIPSQTRRTLPTMTARIPSWMQGPIRRVLPHAQDKGAVTVHLPSRGNVTPAQQDGFFLWARENWLLCNNDLDHDSAWHDIRDRENQRELFQSIAMERIESWDIHPWPASNRSVSQHLAGMFAYSVANCHLPLLRLALQHKGALPKNIFTGLLPNHDHLPALHVACKLGFDVLLPALFEVCDRFTTDSRLRTALHYAAESGHIACVGDLAPGSNASRKELVNRRDVQSNQALHLALVNGYDDVVLCLLKDWGASISLQDPKLGFAVDVALNNGLGTFIQRLLDKGWLVEDELTVDQSDKLVKAAEADNARQFILAVMAGEVEKFMAHSNATNMHARDHDGLTALWHASQRGYDKVVEALLNTLYFDESRELLVADSKGRTALIVAVISGNTNVIRLLVQSTLVSQAVRPDKDGWLPAEHAVFQSHLSGLQHSAKTMLVDHIRQDDVIRLLTTRLNMDCFYTLLQAAAEIGNSRVVRSLLSLHSRVQLLGHRLGSTAGDRDALFLKKRRLSSEDFMSICNATKLPYPMAIYLAAVKQHKYVLSLLLSLGQQEQRDTQWFMALGLKLRDAYTDATSKLIRELDLGTMH